MHLFKNHHEDREEEHDFSKGSVAGTILRLALPLIVAQFINVLYNIVDRIYIGRIPGASSAALTGVGVAFPIITAITAFSNLIGTGGPPLCSIARGKGDEDRAERIYRAGKSQACYFFSLLRKAVIVIPLTLWLPHVAGLGVNGVFLAEPISNFIGGTACFVTMLCVMWPALSEENEQKIKKKKQIR